MSATVELLQRADAANSDLIVASLEAVNKNYGSVRALRGVDFRVRAGEVVALLGPNGAGKTTAVKLLLGLMQPNGGRVRVFAGDPTNPENRMRTGAMLQVGRVPETLRVREHIDLFSAYYEKPMASAEIWPPPGWRNFAIASSATSPEARSNACCSPSPFAAIPTCFFSTSPPSGST